jgi:preprotein translocase subunit YajC
MEALLPLIITFGLMWALLIRPQQRRVREHQQLVSTLAAGDEVITTGGIVGTIVSVVDDIVTLEVAPGMSIRVLRSAVQSRIAGFGEDPTDDDAYENADDGFVDDGGLDDEDLFDEGQFDAEPVAEPPSSEVPEADVSYIPPPPPPPEPPSSGPPSSGPPSSGPPPPTTGEKT